MQIARVANVYEEQFQWKVVEERGKLEKKCDDDQSGNAGGGTASRTES